MRSQERTLKNDLRMVDKIRNYVSKLRKEFRDHISRCSKYEEITRWER